MSSSSKVRERVEEVREKVQEQLGRRLDLPEALILAEVFAEEFAEKVPKPPETPVWQTRTVDLKNESIGGTGLKAKRVLDLDGVGEVEELAIVVDSSDFSLSVLVDGRRLLSETWTTLNSLSPKMAWISADRDPEDPLNESATRYYYVQMVNVKFIEYCETDVSTTSSTAITLARVYGRYRLRFEPERREPPKAAYRPRFQRPNFSRFNGK